MAKQISLQILEPQLPESLVAAIENISSSAYLGEKEPSTITQEGKYYFRAISAGNYVINSTTIAISTTEISENIEVFSIVGRYLEHSRIYYFENDGESKIYLSSADLMSRNLDRRIEIMFPVEDENLKDQIVKILELNLTDNVKRRILEPDGTYRNSNARSSKKINAQSEFYKLAKKGSISG